MGGNAIKNDGFPVIRLEKENYEIFKDNVMEFLHAIFKDQKIKNPENDFYYPAIPKTYEEKSSFGDIDVLIDVDGLKTVDKVHVVEKLMNHFGVSEENPYYPRSTIFRNGDATSIGLPVNHGKPEEGIFQVDVISSHTKIFDYNLNYFSWNDLGNLMGVISSKTNQLKHGHNGLFAMVRDGDNLLGTVELSTDFDVALKFLGYDKSRYDQGFKNLDEIYNFVASTQWFNPEYFLDKNRSHTQRIRDRKRPTYRGFLEWCQEQQGKGSFDDKLPIADTFWANRVLEFFPEFVEKETALREKSAKKQEIKTYFNGNLVRELKPELSGKDLGIFMESIKNSFKNEKEFETFIFEHKENSVKYFIDNESSFKKIKKSGLKP